MNTTSDGQEPDLDLSPYYLDKGSGLTPTVARWIIALALIFTAIILIAVFWEEIRALAFWATLHFFLFLERIF